MAWSDLNNATRVRDYIAAVCRSVIDQERPGTEFGIVTSIDRRGFACTVQLAGDDAEIPVRLGNAQPATVGCTVRIEGSRNNRYVAEVLGNQHPVGAPLHPLVFFNPGIVVTENAPGVDSFYAPAVVNKVTTVVHTPDSGGFEYGVDVTITKNGDYFLGPFTNPWDDPDTVHTFDITEEDYGYDYLLAAPTDTFGIHTETSSLTLRGLTTKVFGNYGVVK